MITLNDVTVLLTTLEYTHVIKLPHRIKCLENKYLRKPEVFVERIQDCNVIEKFAKHDNTICHAQIPMTSSIC